jgi:hypothetical protein
VSQLPCQKQFGLFFQYLWITTCFAETQEAPPESISSHKPNGFAK